MQKRIVCEFVVDVEGVPPPDDVIVNAFFNQLNFGVIVSENYDGTEDWAIEARELNIRVEDAK